MALQDGAMRFFVFRKEIRIILSEIKCFFYNSKFLVMSHGKNGNYALHHAKPFCHFCGTIIIYILISFLKKRTKLLY